MPDDVADNDSWKHCGQEVEKPCGAVGESLFYCGGVRYTSTASLVGPMMGGFSMEPPLIRGAKGIVEGPASQVVEGVAALSVRFPVLFDKVLDVNLEDLARTKPPPPDKWLVIGGVAAFFTIAILLFAAIFYYAIQDDGEEPEQQEEKRDPSGATRAGAGEARAERVAGRTDDGSETLRHRSVAAPSS